jgi:DNA-binding NarL/FixJ family response regulator
MSVRCVIVDDNAGFLQAARNMLETGGITVVGTVSTSAEALDLIRRAGPDVALVDVALGAESGFDLARLLAASPASRATQGSQRTKVIMISTRAEEDVADLVKVSPAIAFLPKWELSAAAVSALVLDAGR